MQKIISIILAGTVIAQLLGIIFRHSFTIGGEIFVPALVLLIRQAIIKTADIFCETAEKSEGGKADE